MHITHSWSIPRLLPFPYQLVEHLYVYITKLVLLAEHLYVYITKLVLLTPIVTVHYSTDQSAFRKANFLNVN